MKLIDIKNLTFEYFRRDAEGNVEEMVEALKDVSLDVKQGEFIAILGKNGSGKSTLAKHINALLLPGEGEVIVDGMDTADEEVRLHIRQTAGMVFQNPDNQIVANIVEEDVAFGPENMGVPTPDIWNRVDVGLNETEMQEYRQKSPNHLSGGQKQRVAIAGILAMEPKCIVFDEATAMLDPKGRMQMIQVAKKLQQEKGITIILITHHMDEVLEADKIFVMNQGKVVTQGSPSEIFSNVEMLDACGLTLPPVFQYRDFLIGENIVMKSEVEGVTNIEQLASVLLKDRINNFDNLNIKDDNQDVDILPGGMKESLTEGLFLDHVSYVYNRGLVEETYALKNVNVSFSRGEFVAIIGHTGSGKSTLTQHLNGLIIPTEGNVYFNGRDVTDSDFSIKELRQKVGYVFQYPEYQLFADTVENDVCFGPRNMNIPKVEAQKRAYEAIKMVGLPDTIYDCSPFQLSGGQKRRVAIAGVLAMNPEYIVLDEPTAGLDPKAALEILTLLKDLQMNKGITIVIVSHSMEEVAEFADRIVVIDQGEIQFDGPTCKVFQKREALQDMGLEIPVGISLLHILDNAGIPVDITKCRYCEICNELLKLKL